MDVHYIKVELAKGSSGGSLKITYPIAELDGKLRILRPIYYEPNKSQTIDTDNQ